MNITAIILSIIIGAAIGYMVYKLFYLIMFKDIAKLHYLSDKHPGGDGRLEFGVKILKRLVDLDKEYIDFQHQYPGEKLMEIIKDKSLVDKANDLLLNLVTYSRVLRDNYSDMIEMAKIENGDLSLEALNDKIEGYESMLEMFMVAGFTNSERIKVANVTPDELKELNAILRKRESEEKTEDNGQDGTSNTW